MRLAPEAEDNGLANMLAELLRQNLAARPVARSRCAAMLGRLVLRARDADVTITLDFRGEVVVVHDGALPGAHATIEADSDAIVTMSRLPLRTRWELPIFNPATGADREAMAAWRVVISAHQVHTTVHDYRGYLLLARFTSILSVGT